MSFYYLVRSGDWLSKIARAQGFSDWHTIYDHPRSSAASARTLISFILAIACLSPIATKLRFQRPQGSAPASARTALPSDSR